MQVVKVTLTPTDTVFSQETATRVGDVLTLDADYMYDHSREGFDIFQNFRVQDRAVVLNGRVMGDALVVCSSEGCSPPDVTKVWDAWTACPNLPPVDTGSDVDIHLSDGAVCKKSRKAACDTEEPVCEEPDESCEEEDESEEDEVLEGDEGDPRGGDVVVE